MTDWTPEEWADRAAITAAVAMLFGETKYNPDEPRVPAGSPEGGQWGDGGGGTAVADKPENMDALASLLVNLPAGGVEVHSLAGTAAPGAGHYGVSVRGAGTVLPDAEVTAASLMTYQLQQADKWGQPNTYFAAWHDVRHGKTYLDVVKVNTNENDAFVSSVRTNQFGYFDFGARQIIPTSRYADRNPEAFNGGTADESPLAPHQFRSKKGHG